MIVSRSNPRIKEIRRLLEKKYREQTSLYLAEGAKTVKEAILSGQDICAVVGLPELIDALPQTDAEKITVTREVYDSISDEVNPQGVAAVIKMPRAVLKKPAGRCLLLDGVADPGNLGAIIRTAAAAGYRDIYLVNTVSPYNPKAVRASMSGIYFVNLYFCNEKEALETIDIPLIAADMGGEDVFSLKAPKDFCLCIGNEANGISKAIRERAEITVGIPMEKTVESLNAAVSAGILMYLLK